MPQRRPTDEIEAKLLAPNQATLDSIAALDGIGRFRFEDLGTSSLNTTYLDTVDRDLLAKGVALRVRQKPSGWEMTAKWRGSVTQELHVRPEINVPLNTPPGPPYPLPPGPLRERLAPIIGTRELEPLVVTSIRRRRAHIRDQAGALVAELALDRVQHSAPASSTSCAPYHEVEVELIEGPASIVGEIAALLRSSFPLEPSRGSKFSRAIQEVYGPDTQPKWES